MYIRLLKIIVFYNLTMIVYLTNLPRKTKQALLIVIDAMSVVLCLFLAFFIRLGEWFYPADNSVLLIIIFASPLIALPTFFLFDFYRNIVRYISFQTLWIILKGTLMYSALWGLVTFMASIDQIPRSVILINWLLVLSAISGPRFFARWLLSDSNVSNKVLIYGAGEAGRQLSTALKASKEYMPMGFIDDSKEIYHHSINGLKVYSRNELNDLIKKININQVLLAMPSVGGLDRKEIINFLEPFPVLVQSVPSFTDISQGKVKVSNLREISLRDLLGRESIKPNQSLLKVNIFNKTVLVTGAGGSIGSELCRQILLLKPKNLILYEISESSLYQVEQELLSFNNSEINIFPVIGSVLDKLRLRLIFNYYDVKTIYHAAAYKHVPLVECNQSQGVLNNTIGTLMVTEVAISCKVETFVLISTDKAVRPTNIMGVSKRVAELILQAYSKELHNTCLTMVRFGNVLDSSGSVIPLFKKQIAKGGPLTVTHVDIVRYFMTIPEAVELVIQAGAMAEGGEVYLLDMGEPMKIYDLAVKMIKLSGLEVLDESNPNGDIEIQYTGLRPGEKLYEELLVDGEFKPTENELIMRADEKMISVDNLLPILKELQQAAIIADTKKIYSLFKKLVPEFNPTSNQEK
jgi:FlaA1/EpsC-like NDP-sugar epimerase